MENFTNDLSGVLADSFNRLLGGLIELIPTFLFAVFVFVIGWILAVSVGKIVERAIAVFKVDQLLEKLGFKAVFDRAGLKLDFAGFLGMLVRWFLILVALLTAVDILGLSELSDYLRDVLAYLPNIIVAVLILLGTLLIGDLVDKFVSASVKAAELRSADFLGKISRWSLYTFGVLAALSQLGIARELLFTLFTGIVAMIALAGGLAFGFGGKELARDILASLKHDVSEKE